MFQDRLDSNYSYRCSLDLPRDHTKKKVKKKTLQPKYNITGWKKTSWKKTLYFPTLQQQQQRPRPLPPPPLHFPHFPPRLLRRNRICWTPGHPKKKTRFRSPPPFYLHVPTIAKSRKYRSRSQPQKMTLKKEWGERKNTIIIITSSSSSSIIIIDVTATKK